MLNEFERVDLATMIDAYTINGAYLMKLEDKQGSIEVGKRVDLVVLDRNLFEIPDTQIKENDNWRISELHSNILFSNLHHDPRWLKLLEELGTSPAQLAAIKFEVILPD